MSIVNGLLGQILIIHPVVAILPNNSWGEI